MYDEETAIAAYAEGLRCQGPTYAEGYGVARDAACQAGRLA
jgi:hypothetical protein